MPQAGEPRDKAALSLAVNPVFDPAEDPKEAIARGARPSVSGTRQSPPHAGPQSAQGPCPVGQLVVGHTGPWSRAGGSGDPWGRVTEGDGLGSVKDCQPC